MESKKVFFIINKFSGTGYSDSLEGVILKYCQSLGLEATIQFTQAPGHATTLAKEASLDGFPLVFAMGGDGTVNEVACGLAGTATTMGVLPKGSGNGLARHLGISMDIRKSLPVIAHGRTIQMDTILINGHLSVNVSGIGFDGHVAALFGKDGRRGLLGYGTLAAREFFKYKEIHASGHIDEESIRRSAFIIAIANSSQFGNNATIAPHASVSDGQIELCFIRKVPILQSPGFVARMFTQQLHTSAFVSIVRGSKALLEFDQPAAFHIDGESKPPASRFEIEMLPGRLRLLIPPGHRAV
ncbi:MAG: diacylglycerol kinase family lipid kinase [Cyclobacteriaceae bacterium]|nr:diacylglycerol kinase family lipid kinase [Cyclobacteriaceae bacterium]